MGNPIVSRDEKDGMHRSRYQAIFFLSILILLSSFALQFVYAQQDAETSGKRIFAANCAACHGADGRGGERAPNIATRREVLRLSQSDLVRAVQNGLPGTGMPPFGYLGPQKVQDVVEYLRILQGRVQNIQVPGSPMAGKALFYGKAQCSTCHMINGVGGFLAEDLSDYGLGASPDKLRAAILEPNKNLDRRSKIVLITTSSGHQLTGTAKSEDNFSITLQAEDGTFHLLNKSEIERIEYSERSFMPSDYESKLSNKEINDLVSYLMKTDDKQAAARASSKSEKDDDDQ